MSIDEEVPDDEVVDPADEDVEIEEENDEFTPEGAEKSEEEESTDEETLEVGAEPEDVTLDEEVPLTEGAEPSEEDLQEDAGELGKYKITGLVDYTDEQGNIRGQLEKDSIQEVPVALGDSWVEAGQAERVQ